MKIPRLIVRQVPHYTVLQVIVVVAVIALAQAGSSAIQRFMSCQAAADAFTMSEAVIRQKANVFQQLAPNLREVAGLAREVAKSATADFERSKLLEMAELEERKATRADREAVRLSVRADELAVRANQLYRASWRPWLPVPE
jgi:hypothetical protein